MTHGENAGTAEEQARRAERLDRFACAALTGLLASDGSGGKVHWPARVKHVWKVARLMLAESETDRKA